MSKHTPGPWEVINSTGVFSALGADSGDGTPADSNDGWNICDCSVGVTAVDGEYLELGFDVQKSNARLISAAPDLLEALVALTEDSFPRFTGGCVGTFDIRSGAYEKALAAIAKAKGEPQ